LGNKGGQEDDGKPEAMEELEGEWGKKDAEEKNFGIDKGRFARFLRKRIAGVDRRFARR